MSKVAVLAMLACVQAVSIERRTLRTQDTLDAGTGGGKCDFNKCGNCLDANCVWVKTGAQIGREGGEGAGGIFAIVSWQVIRSMSWQGIRSMVRMPSRDQALTHA